MERQQEYELRKKIADAIQNDVDRVFSEKLEKEIFVECEKYLHDKINVKELIKHPQKIYIFY